MTVTPGFRDPLVLDYLDGTHWRLVSRFDYVTADGIEVRVPAGKITDFATVPRLLWSLLPPTGSYGQAAVLHDFLYDHRLLLPPAPGVAYLATRADADAIFREAMTTLGVSRVTRTILYRGVRLTSGAAWERYRAAERAADVPTQNP